MTKVLLKDSALLIVNAAVGNDPHRPALQNILIADGKARAADGFMLVEYPVETPKDQQENYNLLIPASLLRVCKPKSKKKILAFKTIREKTVEIETSDSQTLVRGEYTVVCPQDLKPFPKILHIKDETIKNEIVYHGKFMVKTLKKLLSALPDDAPLTFRFRAGNQTAIEFRSGEAHGLIMPAFLDENQGEWYKPTAVQETPTPTPTPAPDAVVVTMVS
jgi:hypothetical protein